jgi:hypothetical protein
MRTTVILSSLLCACLAACAGSNYASESTKPGYATSSSSPGVGSSGPSGEQSNILSQDDCDRRATDSINSKNLDAEFDKLCDEIDNDKDSGR